MLSSVFAVLFVSLLACAPASAPVTFDGTVIVAAAAVDVEEFTATAVEVEAAEAVNIM